MGDQGTKLCIAIDQVLALAHKLAKHDCETNREKATTLLEAAGMLAAEFQSIDRAAKGGA